MTTGKLNFVRSYFANTKRYLRLRYYIDIRAEIVGELCGNIKNACILDVGCGNGDMSRRFFSQGKNHLVLLDISENMLALAKRNFMSESRPDGNATFILGDMYCLNGRAAFDYILALGVLAHVDDPDLFIERLASLLKPEGQLLLQLTDFDTPVGAFIWYYHQTKRNLFLKRRGYRMNKTKLTQVLAQASRWGLMTEVMVRYGLTLPGMDRFMPDRVLFKYESMVRKNDMLSTWGSECMVVFKKKRSENRKRKQFV